MPETRFQAVYYRAADASQPVDDFIEGLDPRTQAVLDQQIERLNLLGPSRPHLPFPRTARRSRASFVSCAATSAPRSTGSSIAAPAI